MNKQKIIKVFISEDDPYTRIFLNDIFLVHSKDGSSYKTFMASTIDEARDYLAENKPDVALLDLSMPIHEGTRNETKAGLTLLKELRARADWKDVPIYICSGFDDQELKDEAKELGANGYLVKSQFLPKELIEMVNKAVKIN